MTFISKRNIEKEYKKLIKRKKREFDSINLLIL